MDSENKPGDGFLDLNFAAGEQPETLTRAKEAEQVEAVIGKHDDGTDSGGGALAETEKVTVEAEDTEAEEDAVDEKSKDQSVRSSAKRKKGRRRKKDQSVRSSSIPHFFLDLETARNYDQVHMDSENKPGDGFLDLNFAAGEQPETLTRAKEAEQVEAVIGKHDDGTDSGGGALAETEKVTVEAEDTEAEEDAVDEKSKDQSVRSSAKRKKGRRRKSAAVLDEHDSCCCPFQDENKTIFAVSDLVWDLEIQVVKLYLACNSIAFIASRQCEVDADNVGAELGDLEEAESKHLLEGLPLLLETDQITDKRSALPGVCRLRFGRDELGKLQPPLFRHFSFTAEMLQAVEWYSHYRTLSSSYDEREGTKEKQCSTLKKK
ncbi:hypothetical protein ZIOFF_061458 [Zingiber officinale]|uniref:Uncharacterized protein n=1 Tax=Zingiber officinale TaxID=94328 RepID=A0A8J5EZN0_ZINOF|nr:hypothetical protein ZIOFF_061458 [Zingiber officinale]